LNVASTGTPNQVLVTFDGEVSAADVVLDASTSFVIDGIGIGPFPDTVVAQAGPSAVTMTSTTGDIPTSPSGSTWSTTTVFVPGVVASGGTVV